MYRVDLGITMANPATIKREEIMAKMLSNDPRFDTFVRQSTELLKSTNQPNVITLEQFIPFLPLFNMDKERYKNESNQRNRPYQSDMHRLYNQWRFELGINIYEVTFVTRSKEDETVVYFLDRMFTRIKGDVLDDSSKSMREKVPGAVSHTAPESREQLLLNATLQDVVNANSTPEQLSFFRKMKIQSAIMVTNATKQKEKITTVPSVDEEASDTITSKEEPYDFSNTYLDD